MTLIDAAATCSRPRGRVRFGPVITALGWSSDWMRRGLSRGRVTAHPACLDSQSVHGVPVPDMNDCRPPSERDKPCRSMAVGSAAAKGMTESDAQCWLGKRELSQTFRRPTPDLDEVRGDAGSLRPRPRRLHTLGPSQQNRGGGREGGRHSSAVELALSKSVGDAVWLQTEMNGWVWMGGCCAAGETS